MGNSNSHTQEESVAYTIISYMPYKYRIKVLATLSKRWKYLTKQPEHWHFLCRCLADENCLYIAPRLPAAESWKNIFARMWKHKNMWKPTELSLEQQNELESIQIDLLEEQVERDGNVEGRTNGETNNTDTEGSTIIAPDFEDDNNIQVAVRFRPKKKKADGKKFGNDDDKENSNGSDDGEEEEERQDAMFVLPLHQRLQLIKIRENVDSNKALRILYDEGGWRPGLQAKWKKKKSSDDKKENNEHQLSASVHTVDPGMGSVVMLVPKIGMRPFTFDHVLPGRCSQSVVYETVGRKLVMDFLNGFNATIIMYGQTGSGKTWTMFGPPGQSIEGGSNKKTNGIVPRACEEVFAAVGQRQKKGITTKLSCSYVEVYGGEVSDLLREGKRVGHNKVSAQKYVLDKKCAVPISTLSEVYKLLDAGDEQKRRAATAMNERSSRAHALFILNLDMEDEKSNVTVRSQLFLADLGGSEQVKRSKVHHGEKGFDGGFVMAQHMKEAVNINLGLLALKKCVKAVNDGNGSYVPYQDSKLTMLLSPALGGDSKSTVVVCASMESINAEETMQALRFGEKCSKIENQTTQNVSGILHIIRAIDDEIKVLEEVIVKKERWETEEIIRKDNLVEEGTYEATLQAKVGGEVVRVGKVVGAEKERDRLEELIRRRAALTGEKVELKLAEHGFGGQFGSKADALGGNAKMRYEDNSKDEGLVMKGKKVAQWQT